MNKMDFRFPNHGGCFAMVAWLADQFDEGKRTSITVNGDVMTVHSDSYQFQMSVRPASGGEFCCNVVADDTVLTAVKISFSDNEVTQGETAAQIARMMAYTPSQLYPYAAHILKDVALMRTLNLIRPGAETELRVLKLEAEEKGMNTL